MKAANKWVQIVVEDNKKGGFVVADSSLLEGTVVSVGEDVVDEKDWMPKFTKGQKVLFPATHGKTMEHSINGIKYYFVDKDIILAYE